MKSGCVWNVDACQAGVRGEAGVATVANVKAAYSASEVGNADACQVIVGVDCKVSNAGQIWQTDGCQDVVRVYAKADTNTGQIRHAEACQGGIVINTKGIGTDQIRHVDAY